MITKFLSNTIVKGGVSPLFDNPENYGLAYEDVSFQASDGVELSGWLVKGGTDKIILQSHFGVQACRAGFTPEGKGMVKLWNEEINFLKHVKYLVDKGYSVLMYDFRNHGNSSNGSCEWVTWGPEEAKDVLAAVDFISKYDNYKDAQIGLLSICMGAASTTYAFGQEEGLKKYKNIKAMVAIQPMIYPDFVHALGLPGFLANWVNKENNKRTQIDMLHTSFIPNVKDIPVPTLLVQNDQDEYLNKETIEKFYAELQVEKEMMWLSGIGKKRAAAYDYLTTHPQEILGWFDTY
ncbi:MAG: alpha/beta fold hydrolase, partial [Bacteroidota bacterium]